MQRILDIIFPKKCVNCGKICENWVCAECFAKINYGKIEYFKEGEIKYLISLFSYDEIRDKMLKFKFNDEAYIKNYFIELVIRHDKIRNMIRKCDLIIPVPMYFLKKLKRGYNQSELLASGIARELQLQEDNNLLIKYKNTRTQSLLNIEERKNNLHDCFKVTNYKKIENKNILLVDDIYTTGATIRECIKQLKQYNYKSISILVVAKGGF